MSGTSVAITRGEAVPSISNPVRRTPAIVAVIRWLLSVLFLFAGIAKLLMPVALLASQSGVPGILMKFVAMCEIAGSLGLVLPGHFGISRLLTRLAASGLVIIMVGAVTLTALRQGIAPAIFPLVVGCLLCVVIRKNS